MKLLINTTFLILLSLLSISLFSQDVEFDDNNKNDSRSNFTFPRSSFEIVINNERDEFLICGKKDFDGDFVLTGTTHVVESNRAFNHYSALLMKVNTLGTYLTSRLILPDTSNGLFNVIVTSDSNYLFTGYIQSIGEDTNQLWLYKTDRMLNKLWEKRFMVPLDSGYTQCRFTSYGVETNEGNFVLGATATYLYSNQDDMVLIKINQQGDVLVSKQIHYKNTQSINDITIIPNSSDILLAAYHISNTGYPVRIFRLDSNLNIISILPINSSDFRYGKIGTIACWSTDTTFIYCGDEYHSDQYEIGVSILDTSYTVQKEMLLGKPDTVDYPAYTNCISYLNDTTIYIGGFMNYLSFWPEKPNEIQVYRIDTALNVLANGTYGGNAYNRIYGIIAADDGGCLLYGSNYGENNYYEEDIFVLKISPEDLTVSTHEEKEPNPILSATVYPNPTDDELVIDITSGNDIINARLVIYDSFGRKLKEIQNEYFHSPIRIDCKNLKSGVYCYALESEKKQFLTGKFIKN